jgi:hypothetical protein
MLVRVVPMLKCHVYRVFQLKMKVRPNVYVVLLECTPTAKAVLSAQNVDQECTRTVTTIPFVWIAQLVKKPKMGKRVQRRAKVVVLVNTVQCVLRVR